MRPLLASLFIVVWAMAACSSFGAADSPASDGGSDGGTDAEAPFCPSIDAAFCADFDRVQAYDVGFTATGGDASIALDESTPKSPPKSLRVDIAPRASTDAVYGQLRKALSRRIPQDPIRVDVDVRIQTFPSAGTQLSVLLVVLNDGGYVAVEFTPDSPALAIHSPDGTPLAGYPAAKPPIGDWFHLQLTVDPNRGDLALVYPGVNVSQAQTIVRSNDLPFTVSLGPYATPATSQTTIDYDNLVVTIGQ